MFHELLSRDHEDGSPCKDVLVPYAFGQHGARSPETDPRRSATLWLMAEGNVLGEVHSKKTRT